MKYIYTHNVYILYIYIFIYLYIYDIYIYILIKYMGADRKCKSKNFERACMFQHSANCWHTYCAKHKSSSLSSFAVNLDHDLNGPVVQISPAELQHLSREAPN